MGDDKLIAWTAITRFVLAGAVIVPIVFSPAYEHAIVGPQGGSWLVGALALVVTSAGLRAFTTSQGKVETSDGLLLLIKIILVIRTKAEVPTGSPTRLE